MAKPYIVASQNGRRTAACEQPQVEPARCLYAIEAIGLSKRYGEFQALDALDLQVGPGTIFGFLGPNGAGKSTTVSCLTGLTDPTSGSVRLLGAALRDHWEELKCKTGVMPEGLALFDQLLPREFLLFHAMMLGLDRATALRRMEELLEALELSGAVSRRLVDFSAGMRKKVAFAAAVIHRPDVLFLDEPFESIDPAGVARMKTWLREFAARGGTVFITSHALDTVERLCDAVAIMRAGRLVWQGDLGDFARSGELSWAGKRFHTLESLFLELTGNSEYKLDWL